MADRNKGAVSFSANFEPQIASSLDARDITKTVADLITISNWTANDGSTYAYVGMKTTVVEDPVAENNGMYWLKALPVTEIANWEKVAAASSIGETGVITVNGRDGAVILTAADVGLENVDNTADIDKPVSTATDALITTSSITIPVVDKSYSTGNNIIVDGAIYTSTIDDNVWTGTLNSNWTKVAFNSTEVTSAINNAISTLDVGILTLKPEPYVYATVAEAPTEGNEIGWVILVEESSAEYFWGIPAEGGAETWIEFGKIELIITEDNLQATFNGTTATLKETLVAVQTYIDGAIQTLSTNKADKTYVDTQLATKQGTLTPGANITIVDGTINAEVGETTYTNGDPTVIEVGGIKVGTTFEDSTLGDILDLMLYPELNPTLTNPSHTFTENAPTLVEVGLPFDITFTTNFSRGLINPSYGTSGFRSGLATAYNYTGTNLPATVESSVSSDTQTLTDFVIDSAKTETWTSTVAFASGDQPKTSKNNNYDAPLAAGITQVKSVSVTAVYPFYATSNTIANTTKQALYNGNYFPVDMVGEDDLGNKQTIEYVSTATNEVSGIEFFNTVSKAWEWLSGSKTESVNNFDYSEITKDVNGVDVTYRRYTNNSDKIGARQLRFYVD